MSVEFQTLYLISKVIEVEGKEIIKIYEAMGYTSQSIRNILSKLKKENYITTPGRSLYRITNAGDELIKNLYLKENYYNKTWENEWYIVLIELPEAYRKKRDIFRKKLVGLGYGLLYKSVYISPWDKTNKVMSIVSELEIEEYVTILKTKDFIVNKIRHQGSAGIHDPSNIWNLNDINLNYQEKYEYYKKELEPDIAKIVKGENRDVLQVFIYYLQTNDLLQDLLDKDPMLPPEFLSGSWIGTNVLSSMENTLAKLKRMIPRESFYYKFLK